MKKIFLALLLFPIFLAQPHSSQASIIDRSSSIFFPGNMKNLITVNQTFPLFWWDFLVIEAGEETIWNKANLLCDSLKALPSTMVTRVECKTDMSAFQEIVQDWASDYPARHAKLSDSVAIEKMNQVLAQASLPTGETFLPILRADPFESWKELKALAENRMPLKVARQNGFFYDGETHRLLIPIQFSFPPSETLQTVQFQKQILENAPDWHFIGPHASTIENESQIRKDMGIVSKVGILVLILSMGLLVFIKRWKLIFLFPVVFLGTAIGGLLTVLVFGSIHGLTLSFGTAIIGLALDYGFQSAFNIRNPNIWKSNLCGLMTTVTGLVVLMFSSVPLLRQMMFFSTVGICSSFVIFYWISKKFPSRMDARPLAILPVHRLWKSAVGGVLVLSAVYGFLAVRPNLDMNQFNFQDDFSRKITQWMFQSTGMKPPLFEIHHESKLEPIYQEKKWASENGIPLENLANYIPDQETQDQNLATWNQAWPSFTASLTPTQLKFFEPFLEHHATKLPLLPRSYTNHLYSDHEWISLWLPQSEMQEKALRDHFPSVTSLKEVVSQFPVVLSKELMWMGPLSLILATLIHLLYYRRISYALIALLPFFTGVGLLTLAKFIFHLEISFISVMGIVMVFGFSLDYGIFATDASLAQESSNGFWTGIVFAACATVVGFVPLVFCAHPVLRHLGQTLFFGSVGTILGAVFAIPSAVYFFHPKPKSSGSGATKT